ncbi:MAG: helical backbone metal receptor [Arachnia propionica]|uniref:helical backbone metal receptor n=1 Tax=Arachnia propionica TaxID=1750 RepID=UPI0026F91B1B|nr:helical backbone metal receptor [Arachnia propionica]
MFDDLGFEVPLPRPPRRVVSLVPSLTEAIAVTLPGRLVAATDWCTAPTGLDVVRVRGTKNPDRALITRLRPDLVVANQEENRSVDVARLRAAGVPVWVTRIDSVSDALASLGRLFKEVFRIPEVSWLDAAREVWARPARLTGSVAVPVWRDPWIWVGQGTYPDDVLRHLGLTNVVDEMRYPHLDVSDTLRRDPRLVLLPDEPYPFTGTDVPVPAPSYPVPGRSLFWYGPAMVEARGQLEAVLARG